MEITEQLILDRVLLIRGVKIMLDKDLAEMYGVEVKRLNERVKRNHTRFPSDFMFQLSSDEWLHLKSQNATSSWGGNRKLPFVFTEHGVAMLSSVLNSETAIQVNIQIIRVFTKMKQLLLENKELFLKIEKVEKQLINHDKDLQNIFTILKKLIPLPEIQLDFLIRKRNRLNK